MAVKVKKLPNHPLVRAYERPEEETFAHPLNPRSEMRGVTLSEKAGMQRLGVHLVRIPPGKESCVYHSHTSEEEFFYILSGRGVAEIDDEEVEVGPGDFMGFRTPSVGHHLKNPFSEDLVYLVGGERQPMEVGAFPRLKKRVIRVGRDVHVINEDAMRPFWKARDGDS